MAGLNSGLNPDVVKTALDDVFMVEFNRTPGPQTATAEDSMVLNQSSTDRQAVIWETQMGVSLWPTRAEQANVNEDTPRVGDKATYDVLNFANSVNISKNFFDDDMHDVVQNMIKEFGQKAAITRDNEAMGLFRNGFTTTLTSDGVAWFSDSHVNLNGDTIDNLITPALSEDSLNTALTALNQQKDQRGVIRGHEAKCLVVPAALYKTASEILDSELRSSTSDNDVNVYSSKYGIYLKQSPYLGAAAGGSDTAWFLLGENHAAYRWTRQDVLTTLVDWTFQRNNDYIYKGEYRETYGVQSYDGSIGSNGTT